MAFLGLLLLLLLLFLLFGRWIRPHERARGAHGVLVMQTAAIRISLSNQEWLLLWLLLHRHGSFIRSDRIGSMRMRNLTRRGGGGADHGGVITAGAGVAGSIARIARRRTATSLLQQMICFGGSIATATTSLLRWRCACDSLLLRRWHFATGSSDHGCWLFYHFAIAHPLHGTYKLLLDARKSKA